MAFDRREWNTYVIIIFIVVTLGCGRSSFNRDIHTVIRIVDGNTIEVEKHIYIKLLGIQNTPESKAFLTQNILRKKIIFVYDSRKRELPGRNNSEIYGYVRTLNKISLNGEILKLKLSGLNETSLYDSLEMFKNYTQNYPVNNVPAVIDSPVQENYSGSISDLVKKIEPAVFLILTMNNGNIIGQGTGFFISYNGIGISNYHVFQGGDSWVIKYGDNAYQSIEKIYSYDKNQDFIIFKVERNPNNCIISLADNPPAIGEEIFVVGNPTGLEKTVTKGIVSAWRTLVSKNDHIQIDAAISPGSSGSPVIDLKGNVVAIATSKKPDCEMCNFALNIQLVKEAMETLKISL